MTTTTHSETAAEILASVTESLGAVFEQMNWAEDEITQAQRRYSDRASELYHSFRLLREQERMNDRMSVESVYRAHAREILQRVARQEDTRPGTAVEVVIGLLGAATTTPLTHEGFAICARMWAAAGLPHNDVFDAKLEHYEAVLEERLDAAEADARRHLRDDERTLGAIECDGMHHGREVACRYAPAPTLYEAS